MKSFLLTALVAVFWWCDRIKLNEAHYGLGTTQWIAAKALRALYWSTEDLRVSNWMWEQRKKRARRRK